MKKILVPFVFFWLVTSGLFAQHIIQGRVFDENKEPVIGASVLINGTRNGTVTDFDGNFQLNSSKEYPIVISKSIRARRN